MNLSDTQLVMLSAAAQRGDRGVRVPEALKGAAAQSVVHQLLRKQLVEEVRTKGDLPVWRHDEDEAPVSLVITEEGLAALGIVSETAATYEPSPAAAPSAVDAVTPAAPAEKVGSKRMQLISLLRQPGGASIDDIVSELGWLPHTTRAALTGGEKKWQKLNQNGHTLAQLFKDALDPENAKFDLSKTLQKNVSDVREAHTIDLLPSSLDLIDVQDRLASIPSGKFFEANPIAILHRAVKAILDDYDLVLIDCPPNLGIITLNGLRISNGYKVPSDSSRADPTSSALSRRRPPARAAV